MNARPPKLLDIILCDEIRREDNGKLFVLGMYLGAILVPRLPFRMPILTFFCKWKTFGLSPTGEFRLTNPSKEILGGFAVGAGDDAPHEAEVFFMTFALQNVQLNEAGTYTLSYKAPDGKRFRPIFSFDVSLKGDGSTSQGE